MCCVEELLSGEAGRAAEANGAGASAGAFAERVQAGVDVATFDRTRHPVELLIIRVAAGGGVVFRYEFPIGPAGESGRFRHLRADGFAHPRVFGVQRRRAKRVEVTGKCIGS